MRKIIGCGTGRCGTVSLAKLLGGEHEMKPILPWIKDKIIFRKHVAKMNKQCYVAFYYLKYIDELFDVFGDDLKVVCLKRNKQETVNSFTRKVGNKHHWVRHDGSEYSRNSFEFAFPKYDFDRYYHEREDAIERYWEDYYKIAENFKIKYYDKFQIFNVGKLNTEEGQKEILEFCGKKFTKFKNVHYNSTTKSYGKGKK